MKHYKLRAGAAKVDITPKESLLPIPFFMNIEMDRIVDPVFVRVLALDDGQRRSLFITFEMILVPYPEETLQFVHDITGIDKEYIFMCATHTHEVPLITPDEKGVEWYANIKTTLDDTIKRAESEKIPARIGYGTGKSYINVNRDEIVDGKGIAGVNFERPSDKTVALVRLEDYEGNLIALIINYAVHAVVMNGCTVNGAIGITGDLPGKTSAMLEEELGGVALWTSGAAGDQNPRIMTQYGGFEFTDGKVSVKSLGEAGYLILDYLSKEHTRDILEVNKSILCDTSEAKVFAAECTVKCPGLNRTLGFENEALSQNPNKEKTEASYKLQLLTVGDIAFEGISAEVVTTIGAALKSASPFEKTIVVTHVYSNHGYVPDDWGYENNTFEANGTLVQQGYAEPTFIKGFAEMLTCFDND